MTRSTPSPIIRRDDGSIDINKYMSQARRLRSAWFIAAFRALRRRRPRVVPGEGAGGFSGNPAGVS